MNLINENPELANHVDLRPEIKSLPLKGAALSSQSSAEGTNQKAVSLKETKGILKQNLVTILCGEDGIGLENNLESWTANGQNIFAASSGIQKYSLPKARNESVFLDDSNSEMENPPDLTSKICFLNNKLIVRDTQSDENPVRIYCPKTLQIDKEATEAINWTEAEEKKELTMKFMSEADKETGRLLKESPLFSDGTYLYVVSQKKHIKPDNADEDAPTVPTALVIEQYCP